MGEVISFAFESAVQKQRETAMKSNGTPEAVMGRITIDVKLANKLDVERSKDGTIPGDQVRQVTLPGVVDTGANWLVLPASVGEQLGLPKIGEMTVRYADRRAATRDMVELVEAELVGRKGTFRALLEPERTTALIGAIVLEDLDLVVDPRNQRVFPRDPDRMTAEVE
jgi:predicted aspartyl protease